MADNHLKKSLANVLKDFERDPDAFDKEYSELRKKTLKISTKDDLPLHQTVFLTFDLLERNFSVIFKEVEKVHWTLPLLYKKVPYIFEHRKMGFYIFTYDIEKATDEITKEMICTLKKGISIAEKIFKPEIELKIKKGEIAFSNKYFYLRGCYQFFRDQVKRYFKEVNNHDRNISDVIQDLNMFNENTRIGNYYFIAMIDSYYSYIEHILILLLPFSDYNPDKDDLSVLTLRQKVCQQNIYINYC